jgi:hypothetical protein
MLEEVAVAVNPVGAEGTAVQLPLVPPQVVTKLVIDAESASVPALSTVELSDARVKLISPLPARKTVSASWKVTAEATGAAMPLLAIMFTP